MSKFGTKNALFGYFWARISKKLLPYLKSAPSNLSNYKISRKKQKCLNLGPKMPFWGIFGLEFQKTILIFEISTPKFAKNKSLTHTINFGIDSAYLKVRCPPFRKVQVRVRVRFIKYARLYNTKRIWLMAYLEQHI